MTFPTHLIPKLNGGQLTRSLLDFVEGVVKAKRASILHPQALEQHSSVLLQIEGSSCFCSNGEEMGLKASRVVEQAMNTNLMSRYLGKLVYCHVNL